MFICYVKGEGSLLGIHDVVEFFLLTSWCIIGSSCGSLFILFSVFV